MTFEATTGDFEWQACGSSGYTNLTSFINQTAWRLFYSNTAGDVTELALGTSGQYLKANGVSSAPTWDTPAGSGDLAAVPGSDHSANGPQTNDINAGESITVIDCVYLHSDGEWHKTDADAVATAEGMLAISLETKTNGNAMNVAMPGSFVRDDTWTWTVGGEIYLDTVTAGGLSQTAPSGTDDVVRVVGHATHADRIFFNPDQTVLVHN